jgi:tetratricopeptide (TPR) repeat protein
MADRYADLRRAFAADHFFEAEKICRALLAANDTDHQALYWLARIAVESGNPDAAKPLLGRALATRMLPEYLLGMAKSLRRRGYVELAIELLRSGLERFPTNEAMASRLGQLLADSGDLKAAEASFRRALEFDPLSGETYYSLALIRKFKPNDPLVPQMERALQRTQPDTPRRRDLSFALGRAFHDQGHYDEAFRHFREGNRIKRAAMSYSAERDAEQTHELIHAFTPEFVASVGESGAPDEAPVLVVGMPRSGTTLVEQIIAAHPQAEGIGERLDLPEVVETQIFKFLPPNPQLPRQVTEVQREGWAALGAMYADRLRKAAPGADRIVDKQLYNYKLMGLFHLMLPRGRVVLCKRDPMDTGFSCFTSLFDDGSDFIYDLWEIGHAWRLYEELTDHWVSLFPDRIHTVQYETLVSDPEVEVRKLVEFLDLPWSDDCLASHEQDRPVSTMSVAQVREPIYTSSVERWRHYEKHLEPLRLGLAGEPKAGEQGS